MNTNKNNKEGDINEVAITLEVDDEVIEKVRRGEVTHICLHFNESSVSTVA